MPKLTVRRFYLFLLIVLGFCVCFASSSSPVKAATVQNPQTGPIGIEGTISSAPPTTTPTISIPTNGQSFTTEPVTVSGLCQSGLLVRVFSNGVFIGSAQCANGSFSVSVTLFDSQNQLSVVMYDALDQASPTSNQVSVTFENSAEVYAERGANPGTAISWPISVSGGNAPYAISIDWGDSSTPDLISQKENGTFNAQHTYKNAGVYVVLVKVTDQNGNVAFLQLVGIANGAVTSGTSNNGSGSTTVKTTIIWWPSLLSLPFIVISFWLGRRYELATLRKHLSASGE
jgi:hypothetical protein